MTVGKIFRKHTGFEKASEFNFEKQTETRAMGEGRPKGDAGIPFEWWRQWKSWNTGKKWGVGGAWRTKMKKKCAEHKHWGLRESGGLPHRGEGGRRGWGDMIVSVARRKTMERTWLSKQLTQHYLSVRRGEAGFRLQCSKREACGGSEPMQTTFPPQTSSSAQNIRMGHAPQRR